MNRQSESKPLWSVRSPTAKSVAPEWMSFHFLREAEICPRAAMLKTSSYPGLWEGRGYPPKPSAAAVAGLVVHASVEVIVKKFIEAGVISVTDSNAMICLRELGGYSSIISRVLDSYFQKQAANPRFNRSRDALLKSAKLQIPCLRESIQQTLASRAWVLPATTDGTAKATGVAASKIRFPLRIGTHFEVELIDKDIKWKGRADLVTLTNESCGFVDWKTGQPSDDHHSQMQIYAILWGWGLWI